MAKQKKYKGITYILGVLKKNAPKKYANKSFAREKAREILKKLKDSKTKINSKNVLSLSRKKRGFKLELPEFLAERKHYFELTEYPNSILTEADNRIRFRSTISRKDLPLIQGGTEPSYDSYFYDFVDFINKKIALAVQTSNITWGTDDENYYVVCTQPDKDNISYIISCDSNDTETNYGFDAENPDLIPKETPIIEKKEKKKEEPKIEPKEEPKIDKLKEFEKEIELSKQREQESKQKEKELKAKTKLIEKLIKQGFTKKEIMKIVG